MPPAKAGSGFLYSAYPGLTPWANFSSAASRLVSSAFEGFFQPKILVVSKQRVGVLPAAAKRVQLSPPQEFSCPAKFPFRESIAF